MPTAKISDKERLDWLLKENVLRDMDPDYHDREPYSTYENFRNRTDIDAAIRAEKGKRRHA